MPLPKPIGCDHCKYGLNMMLLQMKSSTLPRRPFTHTIIRALQRQYVALGNYPS